MTESPEADVPPVTNPFRLVALGTRREIPRELTAPSRALGRSRCQGYPTVLCYANLSWDPDWAGETVLYNESKHEFVRSVCPKPGRVVIFDGRIWQNVRVPSRHFGEIRVSVVLHFEHVAFSAT